jgi:membrane protein implicated in regulation of membrane protease activity
MSDWVFWLLLALGFGVGELLTGSFFLVFFAVGGLAAAAVEAVGAGADAAVAAFAAISVLTLITLRPLLSSRITHAPALRTGASALVGRTATVVERIANHEAVGCVRIGSEVWTARSYDDDHDIEVGTRVQVVEIRGATALVIE